MNKCNHTIIVNATIQLQKEFEYICYQYRLKLKRPNIAIEKLANSFGKWDEQKRLILISEDLIFKYKWEHVINILKHEMAHQIVSEIYCSQDVHGNDFVKATKALGLDSFYSKANISLLEDNLDWKSQSLSEEQNSILRKAEKLLNLSTSSNEHEAYLAMAKVRDLYQKYNIDLFKRKFDVNNVSLTIYFNRKRIVNYIYCISSILQDHFFVRVIFSKIFDPIENQENRCLVVMGEKHNVLMAEYVYEFLSQQVETLWKDYQTKNKLKVKFKRSYQKGILEGFGAKLDLLKVTQEQNTQSEDKAIIKTYHSKLSEYVKTQFPKISSINQSNLIYKDHYDKGTQAGKNITLNRPITHKQTSGILKLLKWGK